MKFSISKDDLEKLYNIDGHSWYAIARLTKIPEPTLRYYAKKYGIKSRNRSEAMKRFLENETHPMSGRAHSEETKQKIAHSVKRNKDGRCE